MAVSGTIVAHVSASEYAAVAAVVHESAGDERSRERVTADETVARRGRDRVGGVRVEAQQLHVAAEGVVVAVSRDDGEGAVRHLCGRNFINYSL